MKPIASISVVGVLTALLAASGAPATGSQIRTDTSLGGYSIAVNAAPYKVLLDDPTLPLPRPIGAPVLEADPAYTAAELATGPAGRGIAAALWPGALIGDGWATVLDGILSQFPFTIPVPGEVKDSYPLMAAARYPDNPHTAVDKGTGTNLTASALGLDVSANARANPAEIPGMMDIGAVGSTSTATVTKGVAIGTATGRTADVSLLAGLIKISNVSSTITVRSDGKKPVSSGSTVVNGLQIAGVGYAVDDTGAHAVGAPVPGVPLPTNPADQLKALGITISGIQQTSTTDSSTGQATRTAQGLRITVDTVVLRGVLNNIPSAVTDQLYALFNKVPDQLKELRTLLYYAAQATPNITFVFGAGAGSVAATLPITFDFPPPVFPQGPGGPPVVTGPGTVTPPLSTGGSGPITPTTGGIQQPPVVSPTQPVLSAAKKGDGFGGIPPGLVLLAAAVAATGAWGLIKVRDAAMASDTGSLPDLRGA